ncbi:hypothetical protein N658DRAFT_131107 [Parathielavia hyrcaniae]|uniref:Uncharacterized protein n=1 Tax=Parathielavia hyrcaniae TaxID=113614 RepID=A0AAN6T6D4_9PEZI|nr:hypothetical protein N658DRAFT_131107 [Parathielavia hyrcaniae]
MNQGGRGQINLTSDHVSRLSPTGENCRHVQHSQVSRHDPSAAILLLRDNGRLSQGSTHRPHVHPTPPSDLTHSSFCPSLPRVSATVGGKVSKPRSALSDHQPCGVTAAPRPYRPKACMSCAVIRCDVTMPWFWTLCAAEEHGHQQNRSTRTVPVGLLFGKVRAIDREHRCVTTTVTWRGGSDRPHSGQPGRGKLAQVLTRTNEYGPDRSGSGSVVLLKKQGSTPNSNLEVRRTVADPGAGDPKPWDG